MTRSGTKKRLSRLPNAPLVEAVFELRWVVQGQAGASAPLRADPGFLPFQEGFTTQASRLGFPVVKIMPGDLMPAYSISRRYYKDENSNFPILQVGPGIFATNQSSEYEWSGFKKQILIGVKAALKAYPPLTSFPLTPDYIELRYVDVFDASLVGTTEFFGFLEAGTNLKMDLPAYLSSKTLFSEEASGRVIVQRGLKGWKTSQFSLDIGSGKRTNEDVIRSETKVVTRANGVPKLRDSGEFVSQLGRWLEFAHDVNSSFFKQFVTTRVMERFQRSAKA